jgi:hypothetical protein
MRGAGLRDTADLNPIVPVIYRDPFDNPDWTFELKYDGYVASVSASIAWTAR